MKTFAAVLMGAAALLAAGCATVPTGPNVLVLPGTDKSFDQFRADDGVCRGWAAQQSGITTAQVANESTATGAAVGAGLGAVGGALIGSASGEAAGGAAVGAGVGLLTGTAVGAGNAQEGAMTVQWRYDNAYVQCMYAKGNQIPVDAAPSTAHHRRASSPPPPPGIPPPPSGHPPPPPEGPAR